MSAENDDNRPGREVAYRLFAAEFDDASLSYAESDEERAPNYVVAPTGARLNRVFAVGTLTEVTDVNEEMVRARIVDPTGAFVVYAGQYQPEALAFLERAEPPAFVAVTGKARTFEPDDGDRVYTSVRPESLAAVDADTRDRWVIDAAEHTIDRIGTYAAAAELDANGDELTAALRANGIPEGLARGIPLAQDHYGTTPGYLAALRETALDAVRVVAGERSQVDPLEYTPSDADPEGPNFATLAADGPSLTLPSGLETADAGDDAAEEEPAATTTDPASGAAVGTAAATPQSGTAEDAAVDEDDLGDFESETEDATAESSTSDETDVDEPPADHASTGDVADAASAGDEADVEDPVTEDAPAVEDSDDDELGDFESGGLDDDLYEIDEEEREQIEAEYGTEFTTGADVEEPGEADIDVPDPAEGGTDSDGAGGDETEAAETESDDAADEPAGDAADEPTDETADEPAADTDGEPAEDVDDEAAAETAEETDTDDAADEPADDVDLQSLAVETMDELDDGDGADREAVVEAVVDETGASAEAVEEAIQDALMGGECYEPADGTLKAI